MSLQPEVLQGGFIDEATGSERSLAAAFSCRMAYHLTPLLWRGVAAALNRFRTAAVGAPPEWF